MKESDQIFFDRGALILSDTQGLEYVRNLELYFVQHRAGFCPT